MPVDAPVTTTDRMWVPRVIANQRVGAQRRPMTGSAKQSMGRGARLDCIVAEFIIGPRRRRDPLAPRNDDSISQQWVPTPTPRARR